MLHARISAYIGAAWYPSFVLGKLPTINSPAPRSLEARKNTHPVGSPYSLKGGYNSSSTIHRSSLPPFKVSAKGIFTTLVGRRGVLFLFLFLDAQKKKVSEEPMPWPFYLTVQRLHCHADKKKNECCTTHMSSYLGAAFYPSFLRPFVLGESLIGRGKGFIHKFFGLRSYLLHSPCVLYSRCSSCSSRSPCSS